VSSISTVVLGGLLGAIIWDLVTWWLGPADLVVTRADRRLRGAARGEAGFGRSSHRLDEDADFFIRRRAGDGLHAGLLITRGALLDPASIATPQGR